MLIPRFVVWMFLFGMMVLGMGTAFGQNYPNKPIRIVCAEAGGGADVVARLMAQGLTASFGQQVVVENRPTGVVLGQTVAKATPDGYTLLLAGASHWLLPFTLVKIPFDPVKDFLPITLVTTSPNILVVHPSVQAQSVKELIALAKAKPGELNFGSGTTGTSSHLAGELFRIMAGVNIVHIPYKGSGPAIIALLGGQVQMMFPNAAGVASHVKSGRLRALGVTSLQPSALFPGLPTVAASGVPNYQSASIYGTFAPAGTPATLINRLNQESVRVLNRPDVKEKLFNAGVEVVGSSPEEFAAAVKSEMAVWGKLIKDAGIHGG
jgi:tripartite-type tricarboxylate transporter receptor subunit TctC